MASPHSDNALAARTHHPKNPKAATEIQEDPELWRDIQANVRKMDDLYDATFYTWLRSEDNVLVTASYLQRLAGEYDLERIEHALCWLVNGWRLESIAILVKQVTFDWIVTKGDQGELNRARLMLALTDNWAIQYIARLACTLLTSASVPPPPQPMFRFAPSHTRMASLPGSPVASSGQSTTTMMIGVEHAHPYGSAMSTTPLASSPLSVSSPSLTRGMAMSTPTSPSSSSFNLSTPLQTHGRRMAVSRRLGSPVATPPAGDNAAHSGRAVSTAASLSPALSVPAAHRSGHYRQSSSTIPGQQPRPQDQIQQGAPAMSSFYQSSASVSISTAAPIHPTAQQTSYHPHYCTVSHHHHHAQPQQQPHPSTPSQPQLQQLAPQQQEYPSQQQHPLRGLSHLQRNHGTHSHTRQQSQPGTISTSKQNWLLQHSSYSSSPVFYMNKSLFMEELSRKWSFCRLSEFFQCMDPASGISHRFKCKLLKESALKEELSQKQKQRQASSAKMPVPLDQEQQQQQQQQQQLLAEQGLRINSGDNRTASHANAATRASVGDTLPSGASAGSEPAAAEDSSMEVVMASRHFPRVDASGTGRASILSHSSSVSSSSLSSHSSSTSSSSRSTGLTEETFVECDLDMHPADTSMDISVTTTPTVHLHQAHSQYRPQQSHSHADYNDDMNSGLSRGCKSTDGNHQHCRAQTVEAIMLNSHGAGSAFPSTTSPSSSSSSSFSLTSASAASASLSTLSTLTLTESGMESSSSRPLSQPSQHLQHPQHHDQLHPHQPSLSSFASNYSTPTLYRHATTTSAAPVTAPTSVATSAASAPGATSSSSSAANSLSIHSNGNQRHGHDSTSAKRKNSLGVSLTPPSHCSSFSPTSSSSTALHSSADGSLSSSSAIFPGPRRTSTSASTTNEDLKRLRCSRQNSTSSPSGI